MCGELTEPNEKIELKAGLCEGVKFNEDGDAIGFFMVEFQYDQARGFVESRPWRSYQVFDYDVTCGEATQVEVLEAIQEHFKTSDVCLRR